MGQATEAASEAMSSAVEAYNTGDLDGYLAALSADVVIRGPDGSLVRGREAVRATAEQVFAAFENIDYSIGNLESVAIGPTVVQSGTYRYEMRPFDGESLATSGDFIYVWAVLDGNWQAVSAGYWPTA